MSKIAMLKKSIKTLSRTDFGITLLVTLGWKLIMTIAGFIIDTYFGGATSLFDHTMHWDAGWYLTILDGHYADNFASAAFYPLFPLLVGAVHLITFRLLDYPVAGQIINTIAVWFALIALIKLGRKIIGEKGKWWLVILVLSAPAAFFLHVFYSEAVFIALSLWAYYFALTRRWLGVGILLALLTATRLPSILTIALCGLEFIRAYDWNPKKFFNKKLLYFLLAPLGFIAYSLYLSIAQHDPLGMFHAYQHTADWAYQVFNPNILETIAKSGYQVVRAVIGLRPFDNGFVIAITLPLLSLLILGISSLYLIIKHRTYLPLGIVGLLSIIMFTLNSNIVSAHRYILPILTVYVAIALFTKYRKNKVLFYVWIVFGIIVQTYLYTAFARNLFVG